MVAAVMKKTTRKYVWVLVTNFLLLATVVGLWQWRLKSDRPNTAPAPAVSAAASSRAVPSATGQVVALDPAIPLPDATYRQNLDRPVSLKALEGPVLLNLWASWCAPCIVEMPGLQDLANDYKNKGLQVIALSLDDAADKDVLAQTIARLNFGPITRNWDEQDEVYTALNPEGLPMSYLIKNGKITAKVMGERDWSTPESRALIEALLK